MQRDWKRTWTLMGIGVAMLLLSSVFELFGHHRLEGISDSVAIVLVYESMYPRARA